MKSLLHALSMVLLAALSVFRFGAREECHNEFSTVGTHANGHVDFIAEADITTRFLAVQKGTGDKDVVINIANTRPWGVCVDEPVTGARAAVALFGQAPGTLKVRASKAIAVGAKVFTAAGGKFTDTHSTGAFFCGRAITAAGADGELFELAHVFPVLDASGTAL